MKQDSRAHVPAASAASFAPLVCVAGLLGLMACSDVSGDRYADAPGEPPPAITGIQPEGSPPDAGPAADTADTAVPAPDRIYYDLTAFDWYRRGEPLLFEGHEYLPEDGPIARTGAELEHAGTYAGVDVYAPREKEPPYPEVYVPVFRGYWQPFTAVNLQPVNVD